MRTELERILADKELLMNGSMNVTINDLVILFNKPKEEMHLLLEFSHKRFKEKAEYEKVVEVLTNNQQTH